MQKVNKPILAKCPWCNSNLEYVTGKGQGFISCIDCEFEYELDTEDLIENWKETNIPRTVKESEDLNQKEQIPTTLVDCSRCDGDDSECWICAGSGMVWLDQQGKTIPEMPDGDPRNPDGFYW